MSRSWPPGGPSGGHSGSVRAARPSPSRPNPTRRHPTRRKHPRLEHRLPRHEERLPQAAHDVGQEPGRATREQVHVAPHHGAVLEAGHLDPQPGGEVRQHLVVVVVLLRCLELEVLHQPLLEVLRQPPLAAVRLQRLHLQAERLLALVLLDQMVVDRAHDVRLQNDLHEHQRDGAVQLRVRLRHHHLVVLRRDDGEAHVQAQQVGLRVVVGQVAVEPRVRLAVEGHPRLHGGHRAEVVHPGQEVEPAADVVCGAVDKQYALEDRHAAHVHRQVHLHGAQELQQLAPAHELGHQRHPVDPGPRLVVPRPPARAGQHGHVQRVRRRQAQGGGDVRPEPRAAQLAHQRRRVVHRHLVRTQVAHRLSVACGPLVRRLAAPQREAHLPLRVHAPRQQARLGAAHVVRQRHQQLCGQAGQERSVRRRLHPVVALPQRQAVGDVPHRVGDEHQPCLRPEAPHAAARPKVVRQLPDQAVVLLQVRWQAEAHAARRQRHHAVDAAQAARQAEVAPRPRPLARLPRVVAARAALEDRHRVVLVRLRGVGLGLRLGHAPRSGGRPQTPGRVSAGPDAGWGGGLCLQVFSPLLQKGDHLQRGRRHGSGAARGVLGAAGASADESAAGRRTTLARFFFPGRPKEIRPSGSCPNPLATFSFATRLRTSRAGLAHPRRGATQARRRLAEPGDKRRQA